MVDTAEDYLAIDEVTTTLGKSRATVWRLIRQHNLTTFRLPPDRRTFLRRADVPILGQPVPPGRPVAITKKRGGYRGGGKKRAHPAANTTGK